MQCIHSKREKFSLSEGILSNFFELDHTLKLCSRFLIKKSDLFYKSVAK